MREQALHGLIEAEPDSSRILYAEVRWPGIMRHIPPVANVRSVTGKIRGRLLKASIIGAAVLLSSIGGAAIYAAPVTVPLLTYAITRGGLARGWRIVGALVLALTVAECAWAVAYVTAGDSHPAIWLAPAVVLVTFAAVGVSLLWRRAGSHG